MSIDDSFIHDFPLKYIFMEPINNGVYSSVYNIIDRQTNIQYALKMLSYRDKLQYDWNKEYEIIKNMDHPNIVKMHKKCKMIWNKLLKFCFLLEYIPGTHLEEYVIKNGPFTNMIVLHNIMENLLITTDYLSHKNIVHRDIKPSNIMYLPDGSIKLIDFGLSNFIDPSNNDVTKYLPNLQKRVGTALYMAPELFFQKITTYDQLIKCDIWSLGVVFYYIVSGFLPFDADDLESFTIVLQKETYEPLINLDPLIKRIIEECLVFQPLKRKKADELLNMWYNNKIYDEIDLK